MSKLWITIFMLAQCWMGIVYAEAPSESNVDFSSVCIPCAIHAAQQKAAKEAFEVSTNPMVPSAGATVEGQL